MTNGIKLSNLIRGMLNERTLTINQRADIADVTGGTYEPDDAELAFIDVQIMFVDDDINGLIRLLKRLPMETPPNNDVADYLHLPHSKVLSNARLASPESLIDTPLSDKLYRLNNLYAIITKGGDKKVMSLNSAQNALYHVASNRIVILKSRQRGITTYKAIEALDTALTKSNEKMGLQSFDLKSANEIMTKIKTAYDFLPTSLKPTIVTSNNSQISFSNGSSILLATTFRSQTIQSYHISELGRISLSHESVMEIKSGSFPAVPSNGVITAESTSEGPSNFFSTLWEESLDPSSPWTGLFIGWLGIVEDGMLIPDTQDLDCYLKYDVEPICPRELNNYLVKLQTRLDILLDDEQVAWAIQQYKTLGSDLIEFRREYPATPKDAMASGADGLILHDAFTQHARLDGKYDAHLPTYASFDLGVSDSTVVTLFQVTLDRQLHIIDVLAGTGKPLHYYVDWVVRHEYNIKRIYLPHDAENRDLITANRRVAEVRRMVSGSGTGVEVLHRPQKLWAAVSRVRVHMQIMHFDTDRCGEMIDAVKSYRKKFVNGMYVDIPFHGPESDYCDSLRYAIDAFSERLS